MDLKKYDKLLFIKRELNGLITIFRQSPFSSQKKHKILDIKNQYLGSCSWVFKKLILMDTQRFDIAGEVARNNMAIRERKSDNKMSRDIANFIYNDEKIIL